MANMERLNKRVKKIEEWIAENEDMGGPKGYLDTMVSLYHDAATSQRQAETSSPKSLVIVKKSEFCN